jgi:5'-phosphate synthase pdxT subunit
VKRIGILALQGAFALHKPPLRALGHEPVEVRSADDLDGVEGLILPGGESSVHVVLIERFGLEHALVAFAHAGRPVLAVCAGLILAAREVREPEQWSLGWLDVGVTRNAYGRQRDSFEATSDDGTMSLVFIRAPRVTDVGRGVEVLATLGGEPVLVRQAAVVGASFHPELTSALGVHCLAFGSA